MAAEGLSYQDNPGSLPATYTVQPGLEVTLESVSARFSGAAASGQFLICLGIYSQDDKLIGRYFPTTTLSVGDSGEVSFGTFLGGSSVTLPIPPTSLGVLGCRSKYWTGIVPSNYSIPNDFFTPIAYNQNRFDTGGFHRFTADANLTGTVSKTAGSRTITGSGTSFTTELAVGDPVKIPGGVVIYYPDVVVVSSITDNTHFECYFPPLQSAAGQVAVKDSTVFVAQQAGYYSIHCDTYWRGNNTGSRELNIIIDGIDSGATVIGSNEHNEGQAFVRPTVSPFETAFTVDSGALFLQQGEYWQIFAYQDSGAALNMAVDLPGITSSCLFLGV